MAIYAWMRLAAIHDPREPIPIPDGVAHCFIAGTRTVEKTATKLRSDLLVTPASALAEDYPGSHGVTRELLHGVDHFQLMRDEGVYGRLGRWMGNRVRVTTEKR